MRKEQWMKRIVTFCVLIVFGIAFFAVLFLGILKTIERGYQSYFGKEDIYFLTGEFTGVPIFAALAVFIIICCLFSPFGAYGYKITGISIRKKLMILWVSIMVYLLLTVGSTLQYEKYTPEGLEVNTFGFVKNYTWQEAEKLTLKADFEGTLCFEVQFKDGKKYTFNGGILHMAEYESDAYLEKFPKGTYDYTVWLGGTLGRMGISVKKEKGLWNQLTDAYWKELAEEVLQEYEQNKKRKINEKDGRLVLREGNGIV